MKKALTVLLSVLLLSSLISCNGGNPQPDVPDKSEESVLEKASDSIDAVSDVLDILDISGVPITFVEKTTVDENTVKIDFEYTDEKDNTVSVISTESNKITVTNGDGEEVEISDEESASVIAEAKTIPTSEFRETETGYIYEAPALRTRSAVTSDSIRKIVITFTYEKNKAAYDYDVTYFDENGESYNIVESTSKEMTMKVGNNDINLSDDLHSAFSLDAVQTTEKKETIRLAFSEVHAASYPTTMADRYFASLVEERTNGAVKIDVYVGGWLYGEETQEIDAMKAGDLAFARTSVSPLASFVPDFNVFQLPYLFSSRDHMWKVLDGEPGQNLLQKLDENGTGLYGLAYYDAGARSFYTDTPIDSIDDFEGLKIRVMNSELMKDMVEALGAVAVHGMGPNEVVYAIRDGRIDGAENNWPTYESMRDYKAASYYFDDGHMRVPEVVLASEKVLDSLDPEYVEIIRECAKKAQEYEIEKWIEREEASKEKIEDYVTITVPDEEMMSALREKMNPVYEKYGSDFSDLIDEIQELDK